MCAQFRTVTNKQGRHKAAKEALQTLHSIMNLGEYAWDTYAADQSPMVKAIWQMEGILQRANFPVSLDLLLILIFDTNGEAMLGDEGPPRPEEMPAAFRAVETAIRQQWGIWGEALRLLVIKGCERPVRMKKKKGDKTKLPRVQPWEMRRWCIEKCNTPEDSRVLVMM